MRRIKMNRVFMEIDHLIGQLLSEKQLLFLSGQIYEFEQPEMGIGLLNMVKPKLSDLKK